MSVDILGKVQNAVAQKNAQASEASQKIEISSSLKDKSRELQESISEFERSYRNLKDESNELEKVGVKFDDLRKNIKEYVDRLLY
jgi:c-di-GMP-binding flagellar brake protein YcgR